MFYVFGICGIICVLFSLGTCALAKGAPHEIEGLIWLLIGAVLLIGAQIMDTIQRSTRREEIDLRAGKLARCGACKGGIALDAVRCRHCGVTVTHNGPVKR